MAKHSHGFVETFEGMVGFGLDRESDENTVQVYLQKFSDDALLKALVPRLSDEEVQEVFELISRLIRKHLKDEEYHRLFLKDKED